MLRRILVALKWAIGALAGICVLMYLVLLVINWRDVGASASALQLADLYRNRPPARDQDNGYVYALGFGSAPGVDPLEMGLKRLAWLQQAEDLDDLNLDLDPLGSPFDYRSTRHPAVQPAGPAPWPQT